MMRRFSRPATILLFAFVSVLGAASDAMATHFRYGTITWTTPNPAQPNVIQVRFDAAWRRSYFSPLPNIGSIVSLDGSTVGQLEVLNLAMTGLVLAPVDVDGTVTSVNALEDWITTSWTRTITLPAGTTDVVLRFRGCCRISTLLNGNNDRDYSVTSRVTVRNPVNRPPTSASLPVITVPVNQFVNFTVPAFDPDGDPMTFSLSPAQESGLFTVAPQGSPALTVNAAGIVNWRPVQLGLYAVQFKITDVKGASTAIDVMFSVVASTTPAPPPTLTVNGSAPPSTFSVTRGSLLSFIVNATSTNITSGNVTAGNITPVTLASSALPLGANMSPSLPTSAMGNVSSTFTWTPAPSQVGSYIISYSAINGTGQQTIGNVNINVTNDPPTVICSASGGTIEATGPGGAEFSLTADLEDTDAADRLVYQVFVDGTLLQTLTNIDPPASRTFTGSFPLGNHTYEVRVTDSVSPAVSCTGTFSILDTTAPTLFLPANATIDGSGPGAVFTYSATATDIVDTSVPVICDIPSGSTFSYGTNTVNCIATDDAGNPAAASFLVDVNDPTGPIVTYAIAGTIGGDGWYTSDVNVAFTVTDPDSGIASTTGCAPQLVNADTAGVDFTCTATNNSGVSTTVTTSSIRRDATAPTISHAIATIVAEATSGAGAVVSYAAPTVIDNLSGVDSTSCTHPSGATFALGTTMVSCTVSDKAGNSSSADLSIVVRDTTAPSIDALSGAIFEATSPAGAAISYATPSAADAVDASVTVVCAPIAGTVVGFTPVTVTCTATDDAGNSASTSAAFAAVDTTAPSIGALPNLTQPGTNPAGEVMTWAATATDIVSGNVAVVCDPASGSTFGYAVTPVNCTATDAAGNTASAAFTVEITDATPPQINVAVAGTLGNNDWYTSNVTVTWAVTDAQSPVTSTGCDAMTIETDGTVTLTCSATSAGGTATQSITIKRDATAPALTLPASFSTLATATTGATVSYTASADDLTSGLASFACAPPSGSLFPIAANAVNCTATNNAGLTANGTFTITVNDTIPPVITSTTPSVNSLWPPNHQMVPVTVTVAASDNLGPAPVCSVSSVSSNEPQNGLGDGDTPNDWLLTGGLTLQLRSERAGRGDGREYTIDVRCVDGSGNATTSSTIVTVPKSQSR